MAKQVKLVLIWHMHQPPYEDPITGVYAMPWGVLHAMRDYLDMPAICREQGVRATFNLVPSLLFELEDYAKQSLQDRFLAVSLKNAARLTDTEKAFLVENFFELHQETMVRPYPRYRELARRAQAADNSARGGWRVFDTQDLRDLQMWYYLTWTGETLRTRPVVKKLLDKGRDFTEADKRSLRKEVVSFLNEVVPFYRKANDEGAIEVCCSPLYHPILPLLVETEAAREANPNVQLPLERFRYPEDARMQVRKGRSALEERLGRQPSGLWPPECSISPAVVRMLGEEGVQWIAADGDMLSGSVPLDRDRDLYTPWRYDDVNIFFRDHRLSDLIGFVYSKWEPEEAARHFVSELEGIADRHQGPGDPVVTVALDGENAWEYYIHGGFNFLRILYAAIRDSDRIEATTPSLLLEEFGDVPQLKELKTGSWISGDFSTWIGDPVKNRAWEILSAARRTLAQWLKENQPDEGTRERLLDLAWRAEASDWFWWFGEGHSSRFDWQFDQLFRHHVKAIYEAMGLQPPEDLDFSLTLPVEEGSTRMPTHRVSPAITGRRDIYYKWLGSGSVTLEQGSIHKASPLFNVLRFGYDWSNLYFSLEGPEALRSLMERGTILELHVHEPIHLDVRFRLGANGVLLVESEPDGRQGSVQAALDTVLEVAFPWACLSEEGRENLRPDTVVEVYVRAVLGERELERFPFNNNLVFRVRGDDLEMENWCV